LPYRQALLDYLTLQKGLGRPLHLASAADRRVAQAVADHLGLFESVQGSEGAHNLKGANKAERLAQRFPGGFAYVGDHAADLKVWAVAGAVILAGARPAVARKARALGKPIEAEFPLAPSGLAAKLKVWRKALRLHQWAKNVLVFVPLLLAHRYRDLHADLLALTAFVAMGLVASATYLINDLSDLAADRRHAKKRRRPFASGDLPIPTGVAAVVGLLAAGFGLALAISPLLAMGLAAYAVLTLAYTFRLKRLALLDVATLGLLYTLRIVIGAEVIHAPLSIWLSTFSMFFFFSISLAKRYAEIFALSARASSGPIAGRGYRADDGPAVLALGVGASTASVLIIVIYLTDEAFPSGIYHHPNWLWVAPFVLMLWVGRVWLLAGRGELDEDPVAFALRDRFSWGLAAPLLLAFARAVIR
jgi:4-hydroxybenzoate polyprenyltransferase